MKVLQAPSNIANQAWLMAEGLRARGHEVQVWQYGEPGYGYPVDRVIEPNGDPGIYMRTLCEAVAERFDVVHFHFARSLIPARGYLPWFWDLPVWRSLGVKIVFTFHGTDIRLRSHHLRDDGWSFYRFGDIPCDEELIALRLAVIRRYAHHSTVGSVLDRPYAPEAVYLPKSVDAARLPHIGVSRRDRPVVLHAPSRRATKGTDLVLAGLEAAKARGVPFELDLVQGLPHTDLLKRVANADIVVEKLLGGDAGVASLEAMAMGKVAVARIRDAVWDAHPDLPVVSADPDTFPDVLAGLVAAPSRMQELGQRGRAYVLAEHDVRRTGERLEALYREPGRTGIPAAEGWTIPDPQRWADAWRRRMERAEGNRDAYLERIDRLQARIQRLEAQAAATRSKGSGDVV